MAAARDDSPSKTTANGPLRRTVPMKVLALGFPRTGTASMQAALEILGFIRTWHGFDVLERHNSNAAWARLVREKLARQRTGQGKTLTRADFDEALGDCQACTDLPATLFAEELIAAYPEAKVVIVERNIDDWHRSINMALATVYRWPTYLVADYIEPMLGYCGIRVILDSMLGQMRAISADDTYRNARHAYREHYARIREATEPQRLLEYDFKDGWGPLCEFLEVEVPNVPFPRVNEAAAFQKRINELNSERFWRGAKFLVRVVVPVAGAIGAAMWWSWSSR